MMALSRLVSLGQFLAKHNCNDGNHCQRSSYVTNFGANRQPARRLAQKVMIQIQTGLGDIGQKGKSR